MINKNYLENYLDRIDKVIEKGTYKDDWNSLLNHKVPNWYQRAKFGIFIHWGVFSVPAFGSEWYPRFMYLKDSRQRGNNVFQHHIETYGNHKEFGYKDFIPMFKAEKFDAKEWADLFKDSGAKFVMPVAEHCDGFQMYNSDLSDWNAANMGPKKDILGLLKKEVENNDMVFTASSHRMEHYWFMSGGKSFDSDMPQDIPYGDLYWPSVELSDEENKDLNVKVDKMFMQDWLVRVCEIVDKYKPKIVYFDWWIQVKAMKPYLKKFCAYYYNRAEEWGEEVTINYKNDSFMHTTAVKDIERGQLTNVSPYFWQNDTATAKNSWCYTVGNVYKQPRDIIEVLIDVVSKNGSLLLNVGPKSDGTIPEEDKHILREVGKWLKVNGEGIYNTFPWRSYGEGPTITEEGHFSDMNLKKYTKEDFRFTFKDSSLYIFALNWPEDGVVRIKTLGASNKKFNAIIKNVKILGSSCKCKYIMSDDYLTIISETKGIINNLPVCIKLDID